MRTTTSLIRSLSLLTLLGCVAACSMGETKHTSYEGTPSDWWSDGYMTMVQDAESLQAASPAL